jgi:hypothetical protein
MHVALLRRRLCTLMQFQVPTCKCSGAHACWSANMQVLSSVLDEFQYI